MLNISNKVWCADPIITNSGPTSKLNRSSYAARLTISFLSVGSNDVIILRQLLILAHHVNIVNYKRCRNNSLLERIFLFNTPLWLIRWTVLA
jgi:hypothetical protein